MMVDVIKREAVDLESNHHRVIYSWGNIHQRGFGKYRTCHRPHPRSNAPQHEDYLNVSQGLFDAEEKSKGP